MAHQAGGQRSVPRPVPETCETQSYLQDYAVLLESLPFPSLVMDHRWNVEMANGAFETPHGLRLTDISDGTSNTIMVGEKHIPRNQFGVYPWDCSIYDGHNPMCNCRAGGPDFPLAVTRADQGWKFGSEHPAVVQFVFCDGGVRGVFKTTTPYVLGLLTQRNDGQSVPALGTW